jgi:hypothetical protein
MIMEGKPPFNGPPKTQAEIAKFMQDWASDHGHELGETAAKVRGEKLFNALKDKE